MGQPKTFLGELCKELLLRQVAMTELQNGSRNPIRRGQNLIESANWRRCLK